MARHILLVEDDRDVLVLLQHVLLDAGYAVDCAENVASARKFLEAGRYDLVLTDGRLGDGSGIAIADQAVAHAMKALIITGYSFQLADEGLARHEYLMKPVRPHEVLVAVAHAVGGVEA